MATPGRLADHLQAGHLSLSASLKMLVLDEADLILSYGHDDDIGVLLSHVPKVQTQGWCMEAFVGGWVGGCIV